MRKKRYFDPISREEKLLIKHAKGTLILKVETIFRKFLGSS